jgi:hypothetical protein
VRAAAPLLVAGAILAGAVVRLVGGLPLVGTDLAFESAAAPPGPGTTKGTRKGGAAGSAEEAVAAFYAALQAGAYDTAWDVSVEPGWPGARNAAWGDTVVAQGLPPAWTSKDEFVRRCADELGPGIRLNGVAAEAASAPPGEQDLASAVGASQVQAVHVSGHMLGACLIYRWERELAVAEVGGSWKVLLPGTKAARESFHQSWFSDVTLIGSLRGQAAAVQQ